MDAHKYLLNNFAQFAMADPVQDHVASYGLTWTTEGTGNAYNPFLYTVDPRTYINWKLSRTGKV